MGNGFVKSSLVQMNTEEKYKVNTSDILNNLYDENDVIKQTPEQIELHTWILDDSYAAILEQKFELADKYLGITNIHEDEHCNALYLILWYKHIPLLEYVLSRIKSSNISISRDFMLARKQELAIYLCKKDPQKFFIRKMITNTESIPSIRNHNLMLSVKTRYTILGIHKFVEKTRHNNIITGLPKNVLQMILLMV